MGILGRVLGRARGCPAGVDPELYGALLGYLAPLEKVDPGLQRVTADFVATGEGSAALLSLRRDAAGTAGALGVMGPSMLKGMPRRALRSILTGRAGWDAASFHRLGQVLAVGGEVAIKGAGYGVCGTDRGPMWLRALMTLAGQVVGGQTLGPPVAGVPAYGLLTVPRLRELLEVSGDGDAALLDVLFHRGAHDYRDEDLVDTLAGAAEYLREAAGQVSAAWPGLDAVARARLAAAIGRLHLSEAYLAALFDQAVGPAKGVRQAARAALQGVPEDRLLERAREVFGSAAAGERAETAALLATVVGEPARPLLEERLAQERGRRVGEALRQALARLAVSEAAPAKTLEGPGSPPEVGENVAEPDKASILWALDGSPIELPPAPPPPEEVILDDSVFAPLIRSIDSYNDALKRERRAHAKEKHHWSHHWSEMSQSDLRDFIRVVNGESTAFWKRGSGNRLWAISRSQMPLSVDRSGLDAFYGSAALSLRHLTRILRSELHGGYWALLDTLRNGWGLRVVDAIRRRLDAGEDFRVFVGLWREAGGADPLRAYLGDEYREALDEALPPSFWYYCLERLELLDEALGMRPQSDKKTLLPAAALGVLERFEQVPERYLVPLMDLATGSRKALRAPARRLLAGAPAIEGGIADLLKSGGQETRAGAADWLATRAAKGQVPALVAALDQERSPMARAAMFTALERLGEDIGVYFDAARLRAEAEKGLAGTNLKTLGWLALDGLPALRWRDGGAVDPVIARWWVALANKLKQPGGNALFGLYLDRLAPEDASRLGLFLLRAWIAHDTVVPSESEAIAYAQAHVDAHFKQMARWVQGITREQAFAQLRAQKRGEYLHSAIANKGLLGLSVAADGVEAAQAASAYLRGHGARTAQCKALLEALAGNPAPAAIQVVLATANRFKAKTVQAHAQALIETIAERRGWSPSQLADRTIPTGGLDEHGRLDLDCGAGRHYSATLEGGRLILRNPAGKEVKSLPSARNEEEQAALKAAKRALSSARKEVRQVVSLQSARLQEAMCLEHSWTADDWRRYLNGHPIVSPLCRRLIWLGLDAEGSVLTSFRPLEDRTLSDPGDEAVDLDGLASIRLAHRTLIEEPLRQAWLAHLADYEVQPLFDQLNRPLLVPSAEAREGSEIADRRGHMIDSFTLRAAATRLGYQRGEAEDGGIFIDYVKRYEAAGISVSLQFTGSPLPEENIACALTTLSFFPIRRGGVYAGAALPLKDVPPVLLSETWNDYHEVAAAGTGFAPDWEQRAAYW